MKNKELKQALKGAKKNTERINLFGEYIDNAYVNSDLETLDYTINEIVNFLTKKKESLSSIELATLNYFLGVAWLDAADMVNRKIKSSVRLLQLNEKDNSQIKEKALFAYRSALEETDFYLLVDNRRTQILTNIANLLSTMGRTVEAIEFWNRALSINPKFTMAKGNKAIGIFKYGELLYDGGHQRYFINEVVQIHKTLKRDETTQQEAWNIFKEEKKRFQELIDKNYDEPPWNGYELKNDANGEYRKWCLNNTLFLNPLNDLRKKGLAASDPLLLPSIVMAIGQGPTFQGMYNQFKQEYVSARFLLYEGINSTSTHFSDAEVLMMNTLDYPALSLNVEKVKFSYRAVYSIFDKVAFFLNEYYDLGLDKSNNNLRAYVYKNLQTIDVYKTNWALHALVWLNQDLFNEKYEHYLDPETKLIQTVRNQMEHKYLKILDYGDTIGKKKNIDGLTDDLAFNVPRDHFNNKALKLLKLTRALLIYLSLSTNLDQFIKKGKRDPNSIIPTMGGDVIDDNWKR